MLGHLDGEINVFIHIFALAEKIQAQLVAADHSVSVHGVVLRMQHFLAEVENLVRKVVILVLL